MLLLAYGLSSLDKDGGLLFHDGSRSVAASGSFQLASAIDQQQY